MDARTPFLTINLVTVTLALLPSDARVVHAQVVFQSSRYFQSRAEDDRLMLAEHVAETPQPIRVVLQPVPLDPPTGETLPPIVDQPSPEDPPDAAAESVLADDFLEDDFDLDDDDFDLDQDDADSSFESLVSVPNMIGDFLGAPGIIFTAIETDGGPFAATAGLAGRRLKISENNKPIPQNRIFGTYQHFHNALDITETSSSPVSSVEGVSHFDRSMVGFEQTFGYGCWSYEVRLYGNDTDGWSGSALTVNDHDFLNLLVGVKRLLYMDQTTAWGAGVAVNKPLGGESEFDFLGTSLRMGDEVVYLLPYFGFVSTPNPCCFCQFIAQLDIPLSASDVEAVGIATDEFHDQTLLQFDFAMGRWFYRPRGNPSCHLLSGLAGIVELHYAATLDDGDTADVSDSFADMIFTQPLKRYDILNLTAGLHCEFFGRTTLRVAGVAPLDDGLERAFDAEVNVSLNRFF